MKVGILFVLFPSIIPNDQPVSKLLWTYNAYILREQVNRAIS